MARVVSINEIEFEERDGCNYIYDYYDCVDRILSGEVDSLSMWRELILHDLWFIVYFVMGMKNANHPFVVQACRDVQEGPRGNTLDLWAREHLKSSIVTTADTVQLILRSHADYEKRPDWRTEERCCVFSYSRSAALDFFHAIKQLFEKSDLLKACFPDVLYRNPASEAENWSDEFGITVKRKGHYKEATLEAAGLLDGMPTRKHFTHRVYDDIVTDMVKDSPEMNAKVRAKFFLSENLGADGGTKRIVGTIYDHNDLLSELRERKYPDGTLQYTVRVKPATIDGTPEGKPVFLSLAKIDELKLDLESFFCQQLLNPTPVGTTKLDNRMLKNIDPGAIPGGVWKFMMIDAAGDKASARRDYWALMVGAFEPFINEAGVSNFYITDLVYVKAGDLNGAIEEATKMYLRAGYIRALGIEKVGLSTTEVHVANALRAKGRHLTVEAGNLVILRPEGRSKVERIEGALKWPLANGKVHLSSSIAKEHRDRFSEEMEKFPRGHDDGLDTAAYAYDLAKRFKFGKMMSDVERKKQDRWDRAFERKQKSSTPWMVA